MPSLIEFIREFQQLGLPAGGSSADLFERVFQSLLQAEGPPPEPVPGLSSPSRSAIARSPRGRALFLCHAWSTSNWTCLLLDLAPVVMGRPISLPPPSGRGPSRIVTDYQSQKFQRRVGAACRALDLPSPPEPSRLCALLDPKRLFIAWAPFTGEPPYLKGDIDNFAKNVMDALQRAQIVKNDRTIAAISFTRSTLPAATETLDDRLLADLLAVQASHPKLNQRLLAKKAGVSQRTARRLLRVHQSILQEAGNPPIRQDLGPDGTQPPSAVPAAAIPITPAPAVPASAPTPNLAPAPVAPAEQVTSRPRSALRRDLARKRYDQRRRSNRPA